MTQKNKFAQIAEEALGNSKVISGHEKISTEELIAKYPKGITLTAFDVLANDADGYAVFNFAEDTTKYFNGGALLSKMAFKWVESYDGDVEHASYELGSCGGLRVRLSAKKTRTGKNITNVEIL